MKKSLVPAAFLASIIVSSPAYAWGQKAHQMVNRVAISMVNNEDAQRFLSVNQKELTYFASVPDIAWKNGPSAEREKPLHWFEIDGYQDQNMGEGIADLLFGHAREQLGGDVTTKYGMAMWRTSSLFEKLVSALREKNWTAALQIAGVMGHYVGDMTQPMHATTDYDGQSIGKPGIHKYYETTLVDQMNENTLYTDSLASAGERRSTLERSMGNDLNSTDVQHAMFTEAEGAFDSMDQLLIRFEHGRYDDSWLKGDLKPRMARASALLGKLWDVAFIVSGARGMPAESLKAPVPAWISMD